MNGIGIVILLFTIGLFLGFLKYKIKPVVKGKTGELYVSALLKGLPEEKYILLNDVMLPTGKGTTQIDHVLLSIYGIFVIETKNYKGWIYGGEYSEHWTQNIWGNKYKLYNPILQNQGHVKALRAYLGVRNFPFISVITFSSLLNAISNPILFVTLCNEFKIDTLSLYPYRKSEFANRMQKSKNFGMSKFLIFSKR